MKILLLDIETSPHLADVWGLWQQNVSLSQLRQASYTLCWSAKWYGTDHIYFSSVHHTSPKKMLKGIWGLLDEADVVVHYNGSKFDIPTLNKEFITHGFPPPAPYKEVDLLTTAKNRFRFASNKLAFVAEALGLEGKVGHEGHELWVKCMAGDEDAWAVMEEYNIQDTVLLEQVYNIFRPWIRSHPNYAVYNEVNGLVCPKCGGVHYQKRGFTAGGNKKFQRYQCRDCFSWFRGNTNLGHKQGAIFNVV